MHGVGVRVGLSNYPKVMPLGIRDHVIYKYIFMDINMNMNINGQCFPTIRAQ